MTMFAILALSTFVHLTPADALDDAVAASPDIAVASARVVEAAENLSAARGALVPSLTAGYAQVPQGNPPGPNIISRLANIGLQTNVADFVAYGATVRENVLLLEASRDDALVAIRTERLKTADLYFDALKARAVVVARERAADLAAAQVDAARKRFEAGDGPRLDVVRAESTRERAATDLESARGDDANATDALALETGTSATDLAAIGSAPQPVASSAPTPPVLSEIDPATAVSRALAARAELASAVALEHAEEAACRAASDQRFPSLLVGGGYTTGTDSGVEVNAPSVNVALSLPLGPGARSRIGVEAGKVREAQAHVASERRTIILEVGSATRSVATLGRVAQATTRAREFAERELTATDLGYRNGASSSLDVRSAQTTYAQALVDESSALYDLEKARVILTIEMGP
jgi:outer membrane protein TolC